MRIFFLSFALCAIVAFPVIGQTKLIKGIVVDEGNEPLIGATVAVTGTQTATVTDLDGKFAFDIPENSKTITASYVGMLPTTVNVASDLRIVLKSDAIELGAVVSLGYYKKKPGAITGAIGVVDKDALKQPVVNITQMLQGSTPGVFSVSTSGKPSASSDIQIRGVGSINSSTTPLYIIDGVPATSNDFSLLNPGDVENLTVLKDASATALYGSRGSNGVVLVQTKRGKDGTFSISYRGQAGFSKLNEGKLEMMNTAEKIEYDIMIGLLDPNTLAGQHTIAQRKLVDRNHFDDIFSTPMETSHEVSIRGGNEKAQVYASVGYLQKEGIMARSDFSRITGNLSVDYKPTNWFKMGSSFLIANSNNDSGITPDLDGSYSSNLQNPVILAMRLNPYESLRDENGDYVNFLTTYQSANPMYENSKMQYNDKLTTLRNQTYVELTPIKNLTLKSSFGFTLENNRNKQYASPDSYWGSAVGGYSTRANTDRYRVIQNNQANYNLKISDHNMMFIAGTEYLKEKDESLSVRVRDAIYNGFQELSQYQDIYPNGWGSGYTVHEMMSYYGIVNYDYDNKYFLDLSFRTDGSSRFVNNKWGTFWSVGAQWNMKREKFLEDNDFISSAKLRASVGTQGNSNIDNYTSQLLYGFTTYYDDPAMILSSYGNEDLTWEKTTSYDLGLDFGFLNNRIHGSVDVYKRDTKDLFFNVPTTMTSGINSKLSNAGNMTNTGIEIAIGGDIYKDKDWIINLEANLSLNKNEIKKIYAKGGQIIQSGLMSILKEGEAYGQFYAVRWAGVDPLNGDPMWYDKNGNVTKTYSPDDAVILKGKNYFPNKTAGATLNIGYKGFAVQAMFTTVWDKWIANDNLSYIEYDSGVYAKRYNHTKRSLNTWTKPGDEVEFPRYGSSDVSNFDSRLIQNQSFLKLKNLTVSYALNAKTLKALKYVSHARLFATGQNLWTLTDYRGLDPEVSGYKDYGTYPASRTFIFGVELSF